MIHVAFWNSIMFYIVLGAIIQNLNLLQAHISLVALKTDLAPKETIAADPHSSGSAAVLFFIHKILNRLPKPIQRDPFYV